jgi:probable phosphoglycerate mutase
MLLFYIRHGDPIYSPDSLTPLGHEQAKALAKRLLTHGVNEIYSSPSNRAQLTATPIAELLKKEIKICEWADEAIAAKYFSVPVSENRGTWAFFDFETRRKFVTTEVLALGDNWYTHEYFKDNNFTEGVKVVNEGVDSLMLELGFKHDRENHFYTRVDDSKKPDKNERRIALFGHQGNGIAVLSSILDVPYNVFAAHFDICHTGMSVIHFNENDEKIIPKMLQLSNDSHLYREGILTGYNNAFKF